MTKTYSVKNTFNLEGYLVACRLNGVKLSAQTEGEAVDGFIEKSAGTLNVTLFTPTPEKEAVIDAQVPLFDDGQPTPPTVPQIVTPRQIRLALVQSGISMAAIDAIIDSLSEPDKTVARISWDYAIEIARADPFVISVGGVLGLTPAQIDDLFILAETFL